ncbi:ABC-type cobalamin/Fe3+-siderophore transport system, ATPase component [Frankia torreyi]|uniref:ABC-type cobalamin/Fe3+-siderophore transport system, ATPase component n=2 Tax=Frankia TaxID=1854 RepID=A0A0D8BJI4_9ACTN|nr:MULTISPECIES: ABC transporter ATP-binding protein [Frankia]KJE24281.1 ABC-type cobalamin/Fe3+-siderophore transport system, ATPase component [Frankia torreyi]
MRLAIAGVHVEIDGLPILGDIDLIAEPGEFVGLIGPNGSGKSTLLRTIYRSLRPIAGVVSLGGEDLWKISARRAARHRAVVTQHGGVDGEFTVSEIVAMGRGPHKRLLDREDDTDREIIRACLERVDMLPAAERLFSTLSGGERQRILIARALAQQAPLLILDEPTNHLDVRAQLGLLDLVHDLGLTLLAALHDLNHAAAHCDRVVVLSQGRVIGNGPPLVTLTPEFIETVFGVRAHIGPHPITGRPHIALAAKPQ